MAIYNYEITTSTSSPGDAVHTSSGSNAITTIIVCNTATFDAGNPENGLTYLYMYAVPSGGSISPPDASTTIINGLPIPAGETVTFDQEKMVLGNGDMLVAESDSPANLVMTISTLAV